MQINPLNNASEIYGSAINVNAAVSERNDDSMRIKEEKAESRKNQDSFGSDSATLDLSENSRTAASANGRIVLASEDGIVIDKGKNTREKVKETDTEQVTNLTGFTGSQVESMYREGKVSRADYEKKLESIEELDEKLGIGEKATLEKRAERAEERKEAKAEEKKEAEKPETKKPEVKKAEVKKPEVKKPEVKDRNVTKPSDDKAAEVKEAPKEETKPVAADDDEKKSRIKENLEDDKKFSKEFGKTLDTKNKDEMKNEAVANGIENDRMDLVNQILEGKDDEEQKFNVVE